MNKKILLIFFISPLLFLIDQVIKHNLLVYSFSRQIGLVKIALYKNIYIGGLSPLSSASNFKLNFIFGTILIIFAFLIYGLVASWRKKAIFKFFFYNLIIFGALSNLIDRLVYGFVIDYLKVLFFPVCNLADLMILVGAGGLLIKLLRS